MTIDLAISDDKRPELLIGSESWVREIGIRIFRGGSWLSDAGGEISAGKWNKSGGKDHLGEFREYLRSYFVGDRPLVSLTMRVYSDLVVLEAELLRDLDGLSREDSFTSPNLLLPHFTFSPELSFFLTTFGLGGERDGYPGGYWPTAKIGQGQSELPEEAFAPLVIYGEAGALGIAPANLFLTSPMVKTKDGVGRGLHGAVDHLPAGTRLRTVFAFGEDVPRALLHLGDFLLSQSGKTRPQAGSHLLFSTLGWWNAYGGYYTEPIRPLDSEGLSAVIDGLRAQGIPLGYLGLDLWYPYEEIGQALRYSPDPKKYPQGIGELAEKTGVSTVLHLSALSKKNVYGVNGADPSFYRSVAKELLHEKAIVAWHDWLRTQQHLTPELRKDPEAAERWFAGMAKAFGGEGIDVLLCMQTMGMNIASTQLPNIIAGRAHTDYLFSQPEALQEAARRGHPEFLDGATPTRELHRQNLLMGMVLYSLGMMPFHDLFLSRPHPGLGGNHPEEEAVLRALSCGPVGIGDGPGMSDSALIRRLLLPDGTLSHPDHPPFPVMSTLNSEVQAFFTEHKAGDERWGYLVLINTAEEELPFRMDPPVPGEYFFWDGLGRRLVPKLEGRIPPGRIGYFVLIPQKEGIAPLGLWDRFVPTAAGFVKEAVWNSGWHLEISQPSGPIAVFSKAPIGARTSDGESLGVTGREGVWLVDSGKKSGRIHIYRR